MVPVPEATYFWEQAMQWQFMVTHLILMER
jgi:hypothetical protein